ncbi:hypothetical protein MTBLM1_40089 [Rhodospirillaceae bacterium LM-1]|nr:hypothetical protein MTBLM1_40089 [Rhodospirillaceae bacterium LM-1]
MEPLILKLVSLERKLRFNAQWHILLGAILSQKRAISITRRWRK